MSDTPEMIERVARALCSWEGLDPELMVYPGPPMLVSGGHVATGTPRPAWMGFYERARAAIRALLEPTELMVESGAASLDEICHNGYSDGYRAQYVWAAMCSKALGQ